MKVLNVVGARPQFIKLRPVSDALRRKGIPEFVLHTGQHYDYSMSDSFFDDLELPKVNKNLGIGRSNPVKQISRMISGIADVLEETRPSIVIVYGDTTSTLAGALAATMSNIPVAHVEAGERSFNMRMPEERNRVLTDHVSALLLAASHTAAHRLRAEEIAGQVAFVGDTMLEVVLWAKERAKKSSKVLHDYRLSPGDYYIATVHRAENTDDSMRLDAILRILAEAGKKVLFPVHPRTMAAIERLGWKNRLSQGRIQPVAPLGYLDMIHLLAHSDCVLTDSGGLQKEAFYLGVRCITLRDETEWTETVELGWNILVGTDASAARDALLAESIGSSSGNPYGTGDAGERIANEIENFLGRGHRKDF